MDSQDPRKNTTHTTGHESHGVHVCHKCGWPFPNPHPSARHRRAHKKICGTLEGYKFVDSEGTSLSALSDDDHVSDEDPKTPSTKCLERSSNEKGSGGLGNRSNRSEDDVFTDAVAEFPESGSSSGTGEHMRDVKEPEINLEINRATAQSPEDGSITVTSPPPSNSADHVQMQSTEVPVSNLSGSGQESLDHDSNATIGSMNRSLTDCRTEESGFEDSHGNGGSACDSIPVKLETLTDASQENKKSGTVEGLPETDAKGNEGTILDGQLLDIMVSTDDNDNTGDASEVASELQKREDVTSQPVPAAEVLQLKEGHADDLASGMSSNDLSPKVKSVEPVHSSIATAQIEGDAAQEMDSAIYVNSTGGYDDKGEGNENVHVLMVPNDLPVVADAEKMVKGFKDHEGRKLPQLMNVDSFEVFNNVKDSGPKDDPLGFNSRPLTEDTKVSASDVHVLDDNLERKDGARQLIVEELPDEAEADVRQKSEVGVTDVLTGDLTVVADAKNMVKGFKDHEGGKFPQLMNADSFEVFNNVKDSGSKDDPLGFNSRPLTEDTKVSASDVHVLDDNLERKDGARQLIVEELPDEAEADEPHRSEVGVTDVTGDLEKTISFQSPEEEVPRGHCETSSLTSSIEHATKAISETNTVVVPMDAEVRGANLVGMDDTGNDEKDRIESSEIAVNGKNERNTEVSFAENRIPPSEHASIPSKQVDQRNSILGDVKTAGEEGKTENCNASEIEAEGDSVSGSGEENLLREPNTTSESAVNIETHFTSENKINLCEGKLPEHERTDLGTVLDPQESRKEPESNTMANIQVERAVEVSMAAESDSGGDVEVLWKSSENKMVREPLVSPSETSASLQNSSPVADSEAKDFLGVASENTPEPLPDEGDKNSVMQQVVASATDISVDSSSQTDSLEGHWGSVSVLSTQSDIPTVLDAEPLPSNGSQALSEAEKATLKKPIAASETEHADKSDIFEPPSFMTLVERRDGVNQNAAASEIQITQNSQQLKAASVQAGWFPSITNVVNESQGRKKNEEIIAKVTNWSTGKQHPPLTSQQHTPLKSLLGEASMGTKSGSPNAKEIPVEKDDPTAKDNGASPKTVSSILVPQEPVGEPVKEEEKAWSSPARYPADIKREKRKVKGRPYWAQFVCCSSVN